MFCHVGKSGGTGCECAARINESKGCGAIATVIRCEGVSTIKINLNDGRVASRAIEADIARDANGAVACVDGIVKSAIHVESQCATGIGGKGVQSSQSDTIGASAGIAQDHRSAAIDSDRISAAAELVSGCRSRKNQCAIATDGEAVTAAACVDASACRATRDIHINGGSS